jgi:hypothetical protein
MVPARNISARGGGLIRIVKALSLLALASSSLAAAGQSPAVRIDDAFARLGMATKATVRLTGRDWNAGVATDVWVTAAIEHKPAERAVRLELTSYLNGQIAQRAVADGNTLWLYDFGRNAYSSLEYASSDGALKPDWRARLFTTLGLRAGGPVAFVGRTLADAFGPGAANMWTPFFPTASLESVADGVIARATTPTEATTTYQLSPAGEITGIIHLGIVEEANGWTGPAWNVSILPNVLPDDADFVFVAPVGARAVSLERRQAGG